MEAGVGVGSECLVGSTSGERGDIVRRGSQTMANLLSVYTLSTGRSPVSSKGVQLFSKISSQIA